MELDFQLYIDEFPCLVHRITSHAQISCLFNPDPLLVIKYIDVKKKLTSHAEKQNIFIECDLFSAFEESWALIGQNDVPLICVHTWGPGGTVVDLFKQAVGGVDNTSPSDPWSRPYGVSTIDLLRKTGSAHKAPLQGVRIWDEEKEVSEGFSYTIRFCTAGNV